MNRYDSRVCLLNADVLEQEQVQMEGDGSSSGYDSSTSSDDEISSRTSGLAPCTAGNSHRQIVKSREVMIFTSTGDFHDCLAVITSMPELCDVTFLVGKERVPVHGVKAILATRSRCLYQLILHHQRNMEQESASKAKSKKHKTSPVSNKLTIVVTDYQPADFGIFVNFVHTGRVKVDISSIVGLLCAASEFGFRDLHSACLDFIHRCKNPDQRDTILDSALTYQHKKSAQKVICQLSGITR